MAIKHAFSCTISSGADATLVRPSEWNADHVGDGPGVVPVGGIIIWSGEIDHIPTPAWQLCDGTANSPGPDLRDKFVVGAKQDDAGVPKTNIRGSLEVSHTVTGYSLSHDGSVADHTGLTHSGVDVGTHPDLTHAAIALADHASIAALGGMSIGSHPDLTHAAIAIADHPSTSMTIGVGNHAITAHNSVRTSAGNSITATVSIATTHAVTGATRAAISHNISVQAGTHASTVYGTHASTAPSLAAQTHNVSVQPGTHGSATYGTHAVTQPAAHGSAGTVTHSFTAPTAHTGSIVPAFYALAYIQRMS